MLTLGSTTYRYSTTAYDVNVLGETWRADNKLLSFDMPATSTAVDKSSLNIKLVDPDDLFRGAALDASTNGEFRLYVGFYNTLSVPVVGSNGVTYQVGSPILSSDDIALVYDGRVDAPTYIFGDTEEAGRVFSLKCSSPMAALAATNSFWTTKHSQAQRYTGVDTCFDKVALGGKAADVRWGKTPPSTGYNY